MAPTAFMPLSHVFSVGKGSVTAWKQVSACEQVGCTLKRLLSQALSWLAKRTSELSYWLWQASGAAYLLEIVLGALKIMAIGVGAVLITSLILLIATRTVLWIARARRKRRREPPWYTPAPRGLPSETPHLHAFSAASFNSGGFGSFRTSSSSNYGTCFESTNWTLPPQGTNTYQQFTTPTKASSLTFQKWYYHTQMCLADKSGLQEFPYPPVASCKQCEDQQSEGQPCHHAIAEFFRQSPKYSRKWLGRERMRWHPDKFGQCSDMIRTSAEDMFKIVQELYAFHPPTSDQT